MGDHDVELRRLGAGVGVRLAYADVLKAAAVRAALGLGTPIVEERTKDAPKIKLEPPKNRSQRRAEARRRRRVR